MTMNSSWHHPDRECTEDFRYVEVLITKGQGTKEERDGMAKACLACGEYLDCVEDVIAAGKAFEFRESQAGLTES